MNDFVSISDKGTVNILQEKLEAIAEKRLEAWIRWSLGDISDNFIAHVRSNFLSGQKMKVVTGETRDHIGAWTLKKLRGRKTNTNVIRPGKGIDGLHNYLERWTGTKHEFMRPAFESFGGQLQVTRQIENNLERMISKVNNEK